MEVNQENTNKSLPQNSVHQTLAHSYFLHFFALILGVILDLIFHIRLVHSSIMMPIGFFLLFIATIIIVWAQITTKDLDKKEVTKEHLLKGPYCYTRTPTHYGLFLLILGFGFIMNAFFIILLSIFSVIFGKSVYLKKYENIMLNKFGSIYEEYKKSVKI